MGRLLRQAASLEVTVGLQPFAEPVDLYLMLYAPTVDPVGLLSAETRQHPAKAFRRAVNGRKLQTGRVDERLFTSLPVSSLPEGTYEPYSSWPRLRAARDM
ncbi:MAG: hypothetical protein MZV70_01030 [Desulfobacterales bacterium]|nr:hypothetical protein [Desulfobacterales bacterium]